MAWEFYEFGPFRLEPAGRRLLRDGTAVALTSKVFDTLLVLVEHHGQSLSRSELIARIWPETSAGDHNLNQSIALLRKVLDDDQRQPEYIATLPGRGYSFVAPVRSAAEFIASSQKISPGIIRRRWQYAAAGLAVVLLVAALTMASRLGSRVRPTIL